MDMKRWSGCVALVTGASSGIGAAVCRKLVKEGMTVVGCARTVENIDALANELSGEPGKLYPMMCDLSVEDQIKKMFVKIKELHKKIHVCINCAGFASNSPLATADPDEWVNMLNVDVLGLCICTRESLTLMKDAGVTNGVIIHMGSTVGYKVPEAVDTDGPALGFYYGVKFMIRGLADSLRQELKLTQGLPKDLSKIQVATVTAGAVETEFFSRSYNKEAATAFYREFHCLQPEDIAQQVVNILKTPEEVHVQDIVVQTMNYLM